MKLSRRTTVVCLTTALCLSAVVVCAVVGKAETPSGSARAVSFAMGQGAAKPKAAPEAEPPDYGPLFDALRKVRGSKSLTYTSTLEITLKGAGDAEPIAFQQSMEFRAKRQGTAEDGTPTPNRLHVDINVTTGRLRRMVSYADLAGTQLLLFDLGERKYVARHDGLSGDPFALGVLGSLYFNADLLKGLDDASRKYRGEDPTGRSKLEAALARVRIKLSSGGEPALASVPLQFTMEIGGGPDLTAFRFFINQKTKNIDRIIMTARSAEGELTVVETITVQQLNAKLTEKELVLPDNLSGFKEDRNLTTSPFTPGSPGA